AKADVTPHQWPVGEAAYGIGRLAGGAAHPFYARAVAIRSCADAATVVLVGLDSQGYFTAYKEDPVGAATDPAQGLGTTGIRLTAQAATGVPADQILVSATHTHNSPDSVGIWGGGSQAHNKAPYLSLVKTQTVLAIRQAVASLEPARLTAGTADITAFLGTYGQVRRDPANFPTDHVLRVLQAVSLHGCRTIATIVNAGIHADVAGPLHGKNGLDVVDPDWPGRVATDTERALGGGTTVVLPGGVGRTGPSFPLGTDPHSKDDLVQVAAYGDALFRRVATALTAARPVAPGPVSVVDVRLNEEIAEPALIPLFYAEAGIPGQGGPTLGGTMRSVLPPYTVGNVLAAEAQTIRVGPLMFAGAPGEAYPELATELAARVQTGAVPPFLVGLANDQLGYTPPATEFPVVATVDGGDEGVFTINAHFGSDLVNQHLKAARSLGFATQGTEPYLGIGKVVPDDQQTPAPDHALPEPRESRLSRHC
ncbi:MAG: hypothetical protein M3N21_06790, partial [Actinomycetota bacterium]|nr:hypothetical protein [Actinomycetota bacterium]